MKQNIKSLKIEWETDIEKIDLSVLASKPTIPSMPVINTVPSIIKRIEWIELTKIEHRINKDLFAEYDTERYLALFKLIESGTKIIPPIIQQGFQFINGEIQEINQVATFRVADGNHRVNLSYYLNLKEIPILFIKTLSRYSFERRLWNISCNNGGIEFKEKNGKRVFDFPLLNSIPHLNEVNYEFSVHAI
jgi:hypothetical protein